MAKTNKNSSLIDTSVLDELKSIMEDEFNDVLQVFLDESVNIMSEIHMAFEDESENLVDAVNALKSCSNNVGARVLADIAEDIKQSLLSEDIDNAKSRLGELQDAFTETHGFIKKCLQENMNKVA
jgi:HPt (histidine-containing phosphotransfer) domain-containing protein